MILADILNKLPNEYDFENPVNVSPPKCPLKSFTPVLVVRCMTFFNSDHHCETCPMTSESKNPAFGFRAFGALGSFAILRTVLQFQLHHELRSLFELWSMHHSFTFVSTVAHDLVCDRDCLFPARKHVPQFFPLERKVVQNLQVRSQSRTHSLHATLSLSSARKLATSSAPLTNSFCLHTSHYKRDAGTSWLEMEAAEGNYTFTMVIADQLGDSPRLARADMRELKKTKARRPGK